MRNAVPAIAHGPADYVLAVPNAYCSLACWYHDHRGSWCPDCTVENGDLQRAENMQPAAGSSVARKQTAKRSIGGGYVCAPMDSAEGGKPTARDAYTTS